MSTESLSFQEDSFDEAEHQSNDFDSESSWKLTRTMKKEPSSLAVRSSGSTKNNKNVRELTINKLHYEAVDLVGRQSEMQTLSTCIQRACHTPTDYDQGMKKELILVRGYSGVGKSKLVATQRDVVSDHGGVMVQGKFDQNDFDQPFAGIIAVFGDLFDQVQGGRLGNDTEISLLRSSIANGLQSDIVFLQDLIPSLTPALGEFSERLDLTSNEEKNDHTYEADFEKLKQALRVLTRILSNHFHPLVFVLDDLQWSDIASLKAIEFLLSDTENANGLVVIGLYRSNEVNEAHPLSTTITNLNKQSDQFGFNVTDIEVQSLGVSHVNQIVMALLNMDDMDDASNTVGLAEICYRRTLGNPFFVIEFIRMLEMEDLLSFNLGLLKWTWDLNAIESGTMSTANVVDLLQSRMKRLPAKLDLILQYAACLGSIFKVDTLEILWTHGKGADMSTSEMGMNSLLRRLQVERFLEVVSEDSYRWTHDKVQEAALSLGMATGATFQYDVGCILYRNLSDSEIEESIFEIVNLLNKGNLEVEPEFAKLNLQAGNAARASSAFESASRYASIGIKLLPRDKWTSHREVTLALYTLGAEMEAALGRSTMIDTYFDEILPRHDLSAVEKLPAFVAKSHKLCNNDVQYEATVEFCCETLKQFGWRVPRGIRLPVHALLALKRMIQRAKKTPQSHFSERQKMMKDAHHKAAMLFWAQIYYSAFFAGKMFLLVLAPCKMVELTLEHGISNLSGYAYVSLAMITNAVYGDYKTGAYFAETGVIIQRQAKSKFWESQMLFVTSDFITPWTKPLQSSIALFQRSYTEGMRSGNIEFAMWSKQKCQAALPYATGKPLKQIVIDCVRMVPQMENLGQNEQAMGSRVVWQLCLNLLGEAQDDIVLQGRALPPLEDEDYASVQLLGFRNFCISELYLFNGEYELAAKTALKVGDSYAKLAAGDFITFIETFHRGLALYVMARQTHRRKYRNPADSIRKTIKKWVRAGNPNVKHYDKLLDAEHHGLHGKYQKAEESYQEAIKVAAKTGDLHHAGLFNERYADLLHMMKDNHEVVYRLEEAIRWYKEWGAASKVESLSERVDEMRRQGFFSEIQ